MLRTEPPAELTPTVHRDLSPGLPQLVVDEAPTRVAPYASLATATYPRFGAAALFAPLRTGLALAVVDFAAAWCCLALAAGAAWLCGVSLELPPGLTWALCSGLLIGNWALGLYPGIGVNPVIETRQLVASSVAVFAVTLAAVSAVQPAMLTVLFLSTVWLCSIVVLPLGRMMGRAILGHYAWWRQPVAILAGSGKAQQFAARLRRLRTLGLEPVGLADRPGQSNGQVGPHDHWSDRPADGASYSGTREQLARLIEKRGIQWAIMAVPDSSAPEAAQVLPDVLAAAALFPHVLIVDQTCDIPSLWSRTVDIDGCSARYSHNRFGIRAPAAWRVLKRTMDVIVAGILVLLLLPLFLLIAASILITSPGSVLYSQERVGRGGNPFRAWKFRTMRPNADRLLADYLRAHPDLREEWEKNHKLREDPRVIPGIGRFLRNVSLDELPQLWNVLCGEMSLVGPRPIVEEEIPKYADDFAMYVQVAPGITGLWQISGRNNTTYARRVFLDSYYVRNWSLWLDYYILLRTIKTVLLREGAY